VTEARSLEPVTPSAQRRVGPTLARYAARELWFPVAFTTLGLTVLVLAAQLVALSDLVVNRGLDANAVSGLAAFQLVPALARSLPFAALIGILLGIGRLGHDREILAMEAAGIEPARQLAPPVVAVALVLALVTAAVSLFGAPWSSRRTDAALDDLARANPAASLRAGMVHSFGDFRLEAREVSSRGDELRGVILWVPSIGETFFAEQAAVQPEPDGGTRITLDEGILLTGTTPPGYLRFHHMQHVLPPQSGLRDRGLEIAAATNAELRESATWAGDAKARRDAAVEWQRRLALPVATLLLGLLAVPIALRRPQASRAASALAGIVATLLFFALVQLGNGLLRRPEVPLAAAVWLPHLLLAVVVTLAWSNLLWPARRRKLRRASPVAASARGDDRRDERTRRLPLDRYVLLLFAETAAVCFLGLLVAFVLGDVIDNLQWFAKYGSTLDEVVRFYGARVPVLAARVVPMALLAAAALSMSLLSMRGELVGMWACGVSTLRAVRPILLLCVAITFSYHQLNNELVPRANARASFLKQTEIKNGGKGSVRTSLWYRVGTHLYVAHRLDPLAGEAAGVTVYELDARWLPTSRTDAAFARHVGDGVWSLVEPQRVEVQEGAARMVETATFAKLGRDVPAEVDTAHLTLGDLRREIRDVERSGYDATTYRVDLHQKLASPLACLVLPALGLMVATAGPPFWTPAQTLVIAAVQAVGYLLLSGIAASLGYGRFVSPLVAGWAPIALLGTAVGLLALRSRRQRG
jgi:lipopolysaccharide export system permease protein